ncbi:hypothetical protein [Marinobacterium jannaschii]|uniref:hypothetical protein n=1 Tax=Marinobacterium jannaschii TaxID=64970 RepID=UPI000480A6CC|nr:hypothetical protein [Marinobacterium jannaschii]
MYIQQSSVHFSAEHQKTSSVSLTESVGSIEQEGGFGAQFSQFQGMFQSRAASFFESFASMQGGGADEEGAVQPSVLVMTDEGMKFRAEEAKEARNMAQENSKAMMWKGLLEALTGKEVVTTELPENLSSGEAEEANNQLQQAYQSQLQLQPVELQVNVQMSRHVEEYECTSFQACGKVQTADGKSIDLNLNLQMERSYSETVTYSETRSIVFKDPLVINFEGNAADLSPEQYEFDLDADGENELISFLGQNSAMLALDLNKDGKINDGTELFGALSGDGFADLAQYDEDGNGYIDEADSIFSELRLWNKHLGEDTLETLKERDIGAIYLGASETPFDIKGEDNQTLGRVRESGFYLTENGEAGTVQQIDFAV